jgi:hypothetical protein
VKRLNRVERSANLSREDLLISHDRNIQFAGTHFSNRTPVSGEEPPLPFSFASPTASQESLKRESTAKTGKDPTLPEEDAPAVNAEGELAALAYDTEFEIQEAVDNFNAYLEILREWDAMEKLKQERLAAEEVRCD